MPHLPTVGIVRHQLFRPSETFIANQARALRTFRPVFVGRDSAPAVSPDGFEAVTVAGFGRAALMSYTVTRKSDALVKALAERGTALLHAHFGVEGVYAVPTAKALGVPLITTLHGFDVSVSKSQLLSSKKPSWINYVTWRGSLFSEGASFVCVSEHVRRRAIEWGFPADRTVVLPIGVDVEQIQPTDLVAAPRILHVARLVEKKGTADLLEAFARVSRSVPGAELVVVGDGPLREALGEQARRLGVESSVTFLGVQQHAETLAQLARARLLCVPSVTAPSGDQEGLPTVVVEALAAGKPVVATNHGGIPEAVTDGVNGYLVPERDVAGLADRLLTLLQDPQLCDQVGKAGRATAVEKFSIDRQTAKLESLYRTFI